MKLYAKAVEKKINIEALLKNNNTFYYENDDYIYLGKGDPIEVDELSDLKEKLKNYKKISHKALPFTGGYFGIFNYDLIKNYEAIPQLNKALFNSKNVLGLLVKTFYMVDKNSGEKNIYTLSEESKKGKFIAQKEMNNFLDLLLKKESAIKIGTGLVDSRVKCNISKDEFIKKVEIAKEYIRNGDIFQVVLSQRFQLAFNKNPVQLLKSIEQEKSTFKYYFNLKDIQVLGLSPEILVKRKGSKVMTNPIAGTRKRGKNIVEESYLENDLLNDDKERAEHTMLVDLARNDMGRIAAIGSVQVKDFMSIKKYKNVIHLTSEVLGESKADNFEILKTFLPAGTLSGAPKIRAMEIIESLETDKREIYGGGIGYISLNENMEIAITIRTLVIKEEKAYVQAGAGIVYDSIPAREYEETREKASQLIELLQEVGRNDSSNR